MEKREGFIIQRVRFFALEWRLEKERGDLERQGRKVLGRRIRCMDPVLTSNIYLRNGRPTCQSFPCSRTGLISIR